MSLWLSLDLGDRQLVIQIWETYCRHSFCGKVNWFLKYGTGSESGQRKLHNRENLRRALVRELKEPPDLVKKKKKKMSSPLIFFVFFFFTFNTKAISEVIQHHSWSSYSCGELCEPGMAPGVEPHMGKQEQEAVDVTDGQKNDAVVENQAAG